MIKGELGLLQYDRIERFVAAGALLKDGETVQADLIVLHEPNPWALLSYATARPRASPKCWPSWSGRRT